MGIAFLNADPTTTPVVLLLSNQISNQFFGVFINGSFNIQGLFLNFFGRGVIPVGRHA